MAVFSEGTNVVDPVVLALAQLRTVLLVTSWGAALRPQDGRRGCFPLRFHHVAVLKLPRYQCLMDHSVVALGPAVREAESLRIGILVAALPNLDASCRLG